MLNVQVTAKWRGLLGLGGGLHSTVHSSSCPHVFLFFRRNMPENDAEELEQATMVIFITGKEDPFHPPKDIKMVIKGTKVLKDLSSAKTAFAMYFRLIYTLLNQNIKYPKKLQYTFEFV